MEDFILRKGPRLNSNKKSEFLENRKLLNLTLGFNRI